jgi:hypothetical protein
VPTGGVTAGERNGPSQEVAHESRLKPAHEHYLETRLDSTGSHCLALAPMWRPDGAPKAGIPPPNVPWVGWFL